MPRWPASSGCAYSHSASGYPAQKESRRCGSLSAPVSPRPPKAPARWMKSSPAPMPPCTRRRTRGAIWCASTARATRPPPPACAAPCTCASGSEARARVRLTRARRVRGQLRRRRRQPSCMLFQLAQEVFHTGLELCVAACLQVSRQVLDLHVRRDTVVLDEPLRVQPVHRRFRDGDIAPIEQGPVPADAAHSAPRAGADEGPEAVFAEEVGEDVAVRGRIVIEEAYLRAVDELLRNRRRGPLPVSVQAHQHAPQAPEHDLIDAAAAVETVIDDERVLVELPVELADELLHAERAHVRQIDIGNPAPGKPIDPLTVVRDPGVLA